MTSLGALLHRGDVDALVREIDHRCGREDYAGVVDVLEGCRQATRETGKQLWGPAQYAEYRLALEAPADLAAAVVEPGAARFALGPLTEVVAQRHTFDELAPHLPRPVLAPVAQERVLRGEDLGDEPLAALDDTGLPGRLQPWEPAYPVPTYRARELLEPGPPPVTAAPRPLDAAPGRYLALPALATALLDLVAPWQEQSLGAGHVATVAGEAGHAVAALVSGPSRLVPLTLPEAMGHLAWAGASGGAHGRRRGGAAGRAGAWWVAHVASGLPFPAEPDELEFHLEELRWYLFDEVGGSAPADRETSTGWGLRLAVAGDGWAAALDAHDAHEDDAHDGRAPRDHDARDHDARDHDAQAR